jgi:hypothetical protein
LPSSTFGGARARRSDDYLLAAYADFLLDQGRQRRCATSSRRVARRRCCRLALADQALRSTALAPDLAALRDRFAAAPCAASCIGDALPRPADATTTALALARDNWECSANRETRILLEAPSAAIGRQRSR